MDLTTSDTHPAGLQPSRLPTRRQIRAAPIGLLAISALLVAGCSAIESAFDETVTTAPTEASTTSTTVVLGGVDAGQAVEGDARLGEEGAERMVVEPCVAETPEDATGGAAFDVGAILPETGDLSFMSESLIAGARLAVCQLNEAGGVLGQPVSFSTLDSGTNPEITEVGLAEHLTADVDLLIGPVSPLLTLGVVDRLAATETLACNPASATSYLSDVDDSGFLFRTVPPDPLQGIAIAELVAADEPDRVGIIHRTDVPGDLTASAVVTRLAELDADVEVTQVGFEPDAIGFDLELDAIAEAEPDAIVVLALPTDGVGVLAGLLDRSVDPMSIVVTDGLQADGLHRRITEGDPGIITGMRGVAPSPDPDDTARFADDLAATSPGTSRYFSAHAFDCVISAALAAEAAASAEPADLSRLLSEVTSGGTLCQNFNRCRQLLGEENDIDYDGASGRLELDANGDPASGIYDIFEYLGDGTYVIVDAIDVDAIDSLAAGTTPDGEAAEPGADAEADAPTPSTTTIVP